MSRQGDLSTTVGVVDGQDAVEAVVVIEVHEHLAAVLAPLVPVVAGLVGIRITNERNRVVAVPVILARLGGIPLAIVVGIVERLARGPDEVGVGRVVEKAVET